MFTLIGWVLFTVLALYLVGFFNGLSEHSNEEYDEYAIKRKHLTDDDDYYNHRFKDH